MSRSLAIAIGVAVGWLYGPTAVALVAEWASSADASYGAILCGVALLLVWRRRDSFVAASRPGDASLSGTALLLFGLFTYTVGMLGADVFLTRLSFIPLVGGATLFLAGWGAARVIAAPLVFVLLSIPPPTLLINAITLPLQLVASQIAEVALMASGVPVFRDGNVLHLPSTALEVAEACSGLRSLVSLGALSVLLAWASEQNLVPRAAI